ncbi:MAG: hypothetical protein IPM54_40120 [Polyangiaceae bacterium]|nr:hypothetical protein [Polyangiaceae bacterium]
MTKNPPADEYAKDRENRVKLGHPNIPPAPPNASPVGFVAPVVVDESSEQPLDSAASGRS